MVEMADVVGLASAMADDVERERSTSPSLWDLDRPPHRPANFEACDDIETLLAESVVGKCRYRKQLVLLRKCCKRLRNAVDASVDAWCAQFAALQSKWIDLGGRRRMPPQGDRSDEAYATMAEMLRRMEAAFLRPRDMRRRALLQNFPFLNRIDRHTYYCVVGSRCMLCNESMYRKDSPAQCATTSGGARFDADSEMTVTHDPVYLFAHTSCQRKHMVSVRGSFTQVDAVRSNEEPRELHRELQAVQPMLRLVSSNGSDVIHYSKRFVMLALSAWYSAMYEWQVYRHSVPLLAWLRPHPAVKKADTLYGALQITEQQVQLALRQQQERMNLQEYSAMERREAAYQKCKRLTQACETELRVWLGKGKTRWRRIEDLVAFHEDALKSIGMPTRIEENDHLDRGFWKSLQSVTSCFSNLWLLSAALDRMKQPLSKQLVECLVNHIGLSTLVGCRVQDLYYEIPRDGDLSNMNIAIEAEAYALVFDAMESLTIQQVIQVRSRSRGTTMYSNATYSFWIRMKLLGEREILYTSHFFMAHSDFCVFKYQLAAEMPEQERHRLPQALPDTFVAHADDDVASYMHALLAACLRPEAGMARTMMLACLFAFPGLGELIDTVRHCRKVEEAVMEDLEDMDDENEEDEEAPEAHNDA